MNATSHFKDPQVPSWPAAWAWLLGPLLFFLVVRWGLAEPFIIPSGSMIPTLLINDYVLVNKLAYGWRWPFTTRILWQWRQPQRGDIVVFRYPKDPRMYYVKRVVARGGDHVRWEGPQIWVNGQLLPSEPLSGDLWRETAHESQKTYVIRHKPVKMWEVGEITLKSGEYFVLGDNREESLDSRFWGPVPEENILGTVGLVWLSCDQVLDPHVRICHPAFIRWKRVGYRPQ